MNYEICKQNLVEVSEFFEEHRELRNEATTRLQLIDRLFFECLAWDRKDCISEESHGNEYADYTFSITRRVLIVEAKKEGDYFELPAGEKKLEYNLKTLTKTYPNLDNAIKQVSGYCQSRGIPIAAVCNGHQIVVFLGTRGDGVAPMEGKCIVFPSIESMCNEFLLFWNYLSKPGIADNNLQTYLPGNADSLIPPKLSTKISNYPGLKGRNAFQTDLKILSDLILEDLTRGHDLEEQFLNNCYCQSGALSQYALISKEVLKARYDALFSESHPGPAIQPATKKAGISPELIAEGLSRRPVLLIGDVGVGKTTFIRHLIKVEAAGIFEDSITLYIDLGTQAILADNIKHFVLTEISKQLLDNYGIDIEERNFVRGVHNKELQRFSSGIYSDLRETDSQKFKREEIKFLETLVQTKDQHLRSSLVHISKGRRKQVVLFIDNADQRDYDTQQSAFLIAQEFAEGWPATIFVAIRPETFHRSMREGALSGYHPKAFTISPPRVDRVITQRLEFGLKLASGEISIDSLKSIGYNLENIASVIKAFLQSLVHRDDLIEAIDNIAGGNIRQALYFVKEFFGSGHVATQKIVEIFDKQGKYYVPLHEFLRAVIFGDAKYYHPHRSPIANLFDLNTFDPKGHFALAILIGIINARCRDEKSSGFVEIACVYTNLQDLGYTPEQIDFSFNIALDKKLIQSESHETTWSEETEPSLVRTTTVGAYHVQKLTTMFTYMDAVLVDTPILSEKARQEITIESDIPSRIEIVNRFKQYLDSQWRESKLKTEVFDWSMTSKELAKNIKTVLTQYEKSLQRKSTNP